MAYTHGNKCAKNCCKRTILVQFIVEDVVTCFLKHSGFLVGIYHIREIRTGSPPTGALNTCGVYQFRHQGCHTCFFPEPP